MSFGNLAGLCCRLLDLLIIPGPTILTVVSYSVSQGRQAILPLIAAVALGDATALAFSLLGLGALLSTSAGWFTVIKWVGGLYLLYLGIKLFRSGIAPLEIEPIELENSAAGSRRKLFANTWLVTALNPKGMVFFAAFLPQFVDTTQSVGPQLWILSITFVVLAKLNAIVYALFANTARRILSSRKSQRRFNLTGWYVAITGRPVGINGKASSSHWLGLTPYCFLNVAEAVHYGVTKSQQLGSRL